MRRPCVRRKVQRYTVYDNKTDFPICVSETAKRCAEIMGVELQTFYYALSNKRGNRWHIIKYSAQREEEFNA